MSDQPQLTERDREIAARRYDAAMRRARDIGEEEKGPLAFIIGKTLREEVILELIKAREEGRREERGARGEERDRRS